MHFFQSFVDAVPSALFGYFVGCAFGREAAGERIGVGYSGQDGAFEEVCVIRLGGEEEGLLGVIQRGYAELARLYRCREHSSLLTSFWQEWLDAWTDLGAKCRADHCRRRGMADATSFST